MSIIILISSQRKLVEKMLFIFITILKLKLYYFLKIYININTPKNEVTKKK
jgi:hypothetical protein